MKITNDILKDYFYDKCSHEEEIEIQKWLTENDNSLVDQSFREIISEIQMENRELSQKAFEKFQKATQPQQVRTPRPGLQRSIRWMQRVAAVLFIPLLFLAGYLLLDKKANTHWNDITVPHGMHQTLTLSDGTTLHVNSGTRVIYPSDFTENKREIFVSGELFADVAKDPDKPFIISAGDVHVHGVVGIHRVNWGQIIQPDSMICNSSKSMITGIVNLDGKLVLILDFEAIVAEIAPDIGMTMHGAGNLENRETNHAPILFAEDSGLLSMLIYDTLTKAGYVNVIPLNNGLEMWNLLQQYKKEGTLRQHVQCVVTDIEMPQMDGHRLVKLMKEDPELKEIPIIIFSSLINDDMRRKGDALGADAQLSKNQMGEFVDTVDRFLRK